MFVLGFVFVESDEHALDIKQEIIEEEFKQDIEIKPEIEVKQEIEIKYEVEDYSNDANGGEDDDEGEDDDDDDDDDDDYDDDDDDDDEGDNVDEDEDYDYEEDDYENEDMDEDEDDDDDEENEDEDIIAIKQKFNEFSDVKEEIKVAEQTPEKIKYKVVIPKIRQGLDTFEGWCIRNVARRERKPQPIGPPYRMTANLRMALQMLDKGARYSSVTEAYGISEKRLRHIRMMERKNPAFILHRNSIQRSKTKT